MTAERGEERRKRRGERGEEKRTEKKRREERKREEKRGEEKRRDETRRDEQRREEKRREEQSRAEKRSGGKRIRSLVQRNRTTPHPPPHTAHAQTVEARARICGLPRGMHEQHNRTKLLNFHSYHMTGWRPYETHPADRLAACLQAIL